MQVTARFEGLNLGDGMEKVQKAVADLNLPPAIRVQYGGQFEEQQKSFKDLAFVLVLAIVLVFIVLLFEFGKFRRAGRDSVFGAAFHLRRVRWRCWSPGRPSTCRRSWG